MIKVKICGITHEEDANSATNLGTDFIGLNFYKESPRHVSKKQAQAIASKLPPFVTPVGVFVNHTPEEIAVTVAEVGLKGVQLHGEETIEQIETLWKLLDEKGIKVIVIKALRIGNEKDLDDLDSGQSLPGMVGLRGHDGQTKSWLDLCDYFILDSRQDDAVGGTGKQFPWALAVEFKKRYNKPIFLAGGLTPENVKKAVAQVQPYAVDVASGVEKLSKKVGAETSSRRKDYDKLKTFITEAKQ